MSRLDELLVEIEELRLAATASRREQVKFCAIKIRAYRLKREMSVPEFASFFGVTRMTIFRWEHGRCLPNKLVRKWMVQLGVI